MNYIFKVEINFISSPSRERVSYTYYLNYYPLNEDMLDVVDRKIEQAEAEFLVNELREVREIIENTRWHNDPVYGFGTFNCPLYMKHATVVLTRHPLETNVVYGEAHG